MNTTPIPAGMSHLNKATSYATHANALRVLKAALVGKTRDEMEGLIAVNDLGRFVPVVVLSNAGTHWALTMIDLKCYVIRR